MAGIDAMGMENVAHGICGFSSTLYALYDRRPGLRNHLDRAMDASTRSGRMKAEIKTFLQMMRADHHDDILRDITELTRTFPGYENWTVKGYIDEIDQLGSGGYSIAMPPEGTMMYMRTAWNMRPVLRDSAVAGDVIIGLARTGGPVNRWRNLAHYIYQDAGGTIYSWGEQFSDLADVNRRRNRDYSIIYRIMVHG